MNKILLMIFFFIGLIFVIVELVREKQKCPPQKVVYKYIPRTFEEEQNEPVYVSDIFKSMFTQPTPWISSINELDNRKREHVNQYFISQM